MKSAYVLGLIGCILFLAGAANAGITIVRDTLDYNHNVEQDGVWFIPPDIITDHSPYHRGMWEDWGWTHDISTRVPSDAKSIRSATLTINAWDVDGNDPEGSEIDVVYANSIRLGELEGTEALAWKTTQFELPQQVINDLWVNGKVYIFMDIDTVDDMVGHRVTLGYATLTVEYNVSGKGTLSRLPLHRFWASSLATYLFTISESEKSKLINNYADVWTYQGVEYYVLPPEFEANSAPVYRFWSDVLKTHFYTISPSEKDKLIAESSQTWTYENEMFWAFPVGKQPAGTIPVYRFWSDTIKRHFYTSDEAQKNRIILENADVWTYEGIVWYAYK